MALTTPCLLPVLMFVGALASVALAQQGKIAVIGTVPCSTATVAAKSMPAFPSRATCMEVLTTTYHERRLLWLCSHNLLPRFIVL